MKCEECGKDFKVSVAAEFPEKVTVCYECQSEGLSEAHIEIPGKPLRWFQNARQEWIAETLRVFAFIQRQHLVRKFGISVPQASADIQRFQRENPGAMKYDSHQKRYVSMNHFVPRCDECACGEPIMQDSCPKCGTWHDLSGRR